MYDSNMHGERIKMIQYIQKHLETFVTSPFLLIQSTVFVVVILFR
jgi:hypothetical protein